ncbi:Nicotinamide-nucleotide adenylyltransferase [Aphelenchoides besseyi]|nr:Nicotinamide-nucleotide adenylyltransferase [Aphelenchoides besseyi]
MLMLSFGNYKFYSILDPPTGSRTLHHKSSYSAMDNIAIKIPPLLSKLTKQQIVLVSSGKFNPPHYFHLRMFERARDYLEKTLGHTVYEGILSPISSSHETSNELVDDHHRIKMLQIAVKDSSWIRIHTWQCRQSKSQGYADLLYHLHDEYIHTLGSNAVHLMLICGSDIIDSFKFRNNGQLSSLTDYEIKEVVSRFGIIALFRLNTEPINTVYSMDILRKYEKNIFLVEDETGPCTLSSQRLRTAIRRGESIRYCINDKVLDYIYDNKLYSAESFGASQLVELKSEDSLTLDELLEVGTQWVNYYASRLANRCTNTNDDRSSMHSFSAMETSAPAVLTQTTLPSAKENKFVHFDLCSQASAVSEPCLSRQPPKKHVRLKFRRYNLTSTPETTV